MKQMKAQLQSISKSLAGLSKKVDGLSKQVDKLQPTKKATSKKASATRKTAAKKTAARQAASAKKGTTVLDSVYNVIKRSRAGVPITTLKEKTKLNSRQLSNALYKLTKKGLVQAKSRGVYEKK